LQKPVQEQRDTLEPKHLHISFVFAVALFPRSAQQALHAVFGSFCYPTLRTQYLFACRACKRLWTYRKINFNKAKLDNDLLPTLELIKTAVLNWELDTQIDAAANKIRDGFAQ
jgi:hypothetical protein